MADYALAFDGSQNYVSLGTMGNFGSNLGSGFYCSFQINTTQTTIGAVFGMLNVSGTNAVQIEFNSTGGNGAIRAFLRDTTGKVLDGFASNVSANNGNTHTVEITMVPSTNSIVIKVDGVSKSISYSTQATPASFINFDSNVILGAKSNHGTINEFLACTLDNFQIGTSSSVLYGSYSFNEGTGTTTADSSGNGNTGTLTGSPLPTWVTGLNAYGNVTGFIHF